MKHLGDYDLSTILYGKFTTYQPSTGAPFTLGGGSGPGLAVYKDGSTTQSTAGVTLTTDFDGFPGLNHFAIDTSADGTFYSAGSCFDIVIANGTVDGVSVQGAVVASFTIRKEAALKPTTAGRTLDVSAGGEAGLDWANIGSPATAQNLSGTNIDVDQVVASVSGAVASVTAAVTVGTMNANTLTASALATDAVAEIQSGLSTLDAAGVRTAVGLASANLDTQLSAINAKTTNLPTDPADESLIIAATDAIMARLGAPAGASISADVAAVLASVALRLLTSAYTAPLDAAGTRSAVGLAAANLDTQLGTLATAAALSTVAGYIDTEVAAIKAKTDQLTFGATNASLRAPLTFGTGTSGAGTSGTGSGVTAARSAATPRASSSGLGAGGASGMLVISAGNGSGGSGAVVCRPRRRTFG